MPRPKKTVEPAKALHLDWKAYFDDFCLAHGDPVEYGGRVLFPDGWTYSLTSYKGPEWQPPLDPKALRDLQIAYWGVRYNTTLAQFEMLKGFLQDILKLQQGRDRPLKHKYVVTTDTGEGVIREVLVGDVTTSAYRQKLLEMSTELKRCKEAIKELGANNVSSNRGEGRSASA